MFSQHSQSAKDSPNNKLVLILAVSHRRDNFFVAGAEVFLEENFSIGDIIRFTSPVGATLNQTAITPSNVDRIVKELDIVQVRFLRKQENNGMQPENWIIDHSFQWKLFGTLDLQNFWVSHFDGSALAYERSNVHQEFEQLIHQPDSLWDYYIGGDEYTGNDAPSTSYVLQPNFDQTRVVNDVNYKSVLIIQPQNLNYSFERPSHRIHYDYRDVHYDLTLKNVEIIKRITTDREFLSMNSSDEVKFPFGDECLIVLSLAMPFQPEWHRVDKRYKIVAAILDYRH